MAARTIGEVLAETAGLFGDAPALRQPSGDGGYLTYSWNQYRLAAEEIAAGLRCLGVNRGDVVALNSETRLEFYLADLGILTNGSIAAALYPNYPAADLVRTLQNAGASAVFVEDPKVFEALGPLADARGSVPEQLGPLADARGSVPEQNRDRKGADFAAGEAPRRRWILLTGEAPGALSLEQLRARGRAAMAEDPGLIGRIRSEVQPTDPAILYLTSGATGEPKMALVTHQAVVANIDMGPTAFPLGPEDSTLVFLPSAHIAQRVVMEMLPMRSGMPVTFSESLLKMPQEIRQLRPTILLAPPRVWERIYSSICTELRKRPAAVQKIFYTGVALALAAARYRHAGEPVPARIRVPLKMADRLLFRTIRARFGGRIRVAASGAAPLSKDLAEFYEAIGMPLVEGYGLTEGGVVAFNPIHEPRPGSIGPPLPGVEVRLAEDNELLVKSPCLFSGYLGDPESTAQVLRDGWLHTGDLAHIDANGYIYITGRKKELIVSSTGKKVHPARVESFFKMEPLISQVLLVGDRLPYVTALFTVNAAAAATLKGMEEWKERTAAEIAQSPPVRLEIQKAVARVNRQLAPFEQVRKYRVLPRDFSIEQGELTATMKVRRSRAMENFKQQIDELYAGRE